MIIWCTCVSVDKITSFLRRRVTAYGTDTKLALPSLTPFVSTPRRAKPSPKCHYEKGRRPKSCDGGYRPHCCQPPRARALATIIACCTPACKCVCSRVCVWPVWAMPTLTRSAHIRFYHKSNATRESQVYNDEKQRFS